ncbi:MAG: hypothetical protein AVDCRST_MAG59-43, partial [uncultured Thermomicrobiales bacterium]
ETRSLIAVASGEVMCMNSGTVNAGYHLIEFPLGAE